MAGDTAFAHDDRRRILEDGLATTLGRAVELGLALLDQGIQCRAVEAGQLPARAPRNRILGRPKVIRDCQAGKVLDPRNNLL